MNTHITSYLETYKNDLKSLNRFLYDNPEESYKEYKSCDYITSFLEKHGFEIKKNFLDIETSFYASKGNGHPKVCFLCHYDAIPNEGHITGHNLLTTTAIASSIGLGSVIDKLGGSVIIIGCPGEYYGGTKYIMSKQGVFEDIDIILTAQPDVFTCESGTSKAIIPLSIKFIGDSGLSFLNKGSYTSLDAMLLCFNIINSIIKGFPEDVELSYALTQGGYSPLMLPIESEAKFYIRSSEMDLAKLVESKLREVAIYVSKLIRVQYSLNLYECPNEELITNKTLNRIFCHNMKESGITHIDTPHEVNSGLSLGIVSKTTPTIHPHFSIISEQNIKYGTIDFANQTITDFAFDNAFKTANALINTSIDIIESDKLYSEACSECTSK